MLAHDSIGGLNTLREGLMWGRNVGSVVSEDHSLVESADGGGLNGFDTRGITEMQVLIF